MKTLRLSSPAMRGQVVRDVQRHVGIAIDGVYGPATSGAVRAWKWRYGFHKKFVNGQVTASDYAHMTGKRPKTVLQKVRAKRRAKQAAKAVGRQQRAVNQMVTWANRKLVEQPRESNVVPTLSGLGRSLGVAPGYYRMGWPWCAYAVMLAALGAGSTTARDGLVRSRFNPLYVPEIEAHARAGRYGMRVVPWSDAKPGDFVTFNWDGGVPDHIGMLVERYDDSAKCVEGNTSPTNAGSQSNGGGVFVRYRERGQIQAVIRWT